MAGDGEDNVNEADQTFCYADLAFTDPTHQQTYEHFQRQITNNKTTYTRFINDSKRDITATTRKTPRNDALFKMVQTQKEYIMKESKSKLEKSTSNNCDFVTFVGEHDFNAPQIESFEAFINSLNAEALQKHMNFIQDVSTITEDFIPAQSTSNEGTNSPAKFVNRPDLAEGCTLLSEENNYKETLDFLEKI